MASPMRCPICHREVPAGEPNTPFCGDRCRLIDLANWATGKYVVPGSSQSPGEEESGGDALEEDLEGPVQ